MAKFRHDHQISSHQEFQTRIPQDHSDHQEFQNLRDFQSLRDYLKRYEKEEFLMRYKIKTLYNK